MTRDRFRQLQAQMPDKRILVIGDIMLDRFLWGSCSRISPEAPVPVVHVQRESNYPGGAANVARNLMPFTKAVHLAGVAGQDDFGKQLLEVLTEGEIGHEGILLDPDYETITKTRIVARQQQVVRVDRESRRPLTDDQREQVLRYVEATISDRAAIILEDYGKGMLSQAMLDEVIRLAKEHDVIVTADPNPNNTLEWNGVTALKPNRLEAFRMAGIPEPMAHADPLQDEALLTVGEELRKRWDTGMVLITLGEHGMLMITADGDPHHVPVRTREVFDVSGAGDTAIALLTLALSAGATPAEAVEISNYASGTVVGKLGTATLTPDELAEAIPIG